jgi:hypothetical protein
MLRLETYQKYNASSQNIYFIRIYKLLKLTALQKSLARVKVSSMKEILWY